MDGYKQLVGKVGEYLKARLKTRVGYVVLAYDRSQRNPDVAFHTNINTDELRNVLRQCADKVPNAAPSPNRIVTLT